MNTPGALRSLRFVLLAVAVPTVSAACRAQLAVYGQFQSDRLDQNSVWLRGGTLGIYDDAYHFGPLHVGGDLRGSHMTGDNRTDLTQVLFGLRVAVKPPVLPIRPYAEVLGGGSRLNAGSLTNSFQGAAEVLGGVDFTFFPHLDWRVAEVGGQVAGPAAQQNFHVSTGLVVRFF